ncbi:MAG: hypothetical protein ABII64_06025 [Elusimicrobiota bacterium]
MKKISLLFIMLSASFFLLQSSVSLYAADTGKIQLSVAAPDPVVAGEEITFQVIMVNTGGNKWPAEQYYVESEIYDAEKNYIAKTRQMKGSVTVDPGMANLVYMPFVIPGNFVGTYFYRIFVVYKEQRVIESEYYSFNVVPLPVTPKKPSKLQLGGNAVLSYRQTSKYEWKDYTGNFNLNIVGQVMERAMLFNLYTFHTPKSTSTPEGINHEIYTILFNYYGENWNIGLGDVLPVFSPLSLYGSGMRGGQFEGRMDAFSPAFVAARTAKPIEGTSAADGTYERWLLGGKIGLDVLEPLTVGGEYVTSFDKQESLMVPGPSVTPASNNVAGGFVLWDPSEIFGFEAEYQSSQYLNDLRISTSAINDYAYRVMFKLSPRNLNSRISYQLTRPNFYAFGSPGSTRDRQTIDFFAGYLMFNRLNMNLGLNRFRDNLDADTTKVTTTQSIYSGGLSYASPNPWPSPSVSYSQNEAVGDPITSQNNFTKTMGFSLTGKASIVSMGLSVQQSDFQDLTKVSDDLTTNTMGITANSSFGSRASVNIGTTLTNTKNIVTNVINQTPAFSMSFNLQVLPDKLSTQIWGTMINRQNDAINDSDKIKKKEMTGNGEITWVVRQDMTWTVGGSYSQTTDEIAEANNVIEQGVNTRISYSF